MRIGVAKEATSFRGGFELLITKIADDLSQRGHEVDWIEPVTPDEPFQSVPDEIRTLAPEYFHYVQQIDSFGRSRADFDVVLSTQPPSQAVQHEHQVALFYHHLRMYYDLSDVWVAAGFSDVDTHLVCQRSVRRLDDPIYSNVSHFLAGSETIKSRLVEFSDAEAITSVARAPSLRPLPPADESTVGRHVLCVSRHEFPKRTELGAAAMKLLPELEAVFVGSGGRLGWLMTEDRRWTSLPPDDVAVLPPEEIWLRKHIWLPPDNADPDSNVRFVDWVSDSDLEVLYRDAFCVIAPAFEEDYGLTALEAMAHSKPVVVCSDGGGLAETIVNGENGLVVEPNQNAIAAAVARLHDDRDLATRLGRNGRDVVRDLDWAPYMDLVEATLEAEA